MKILVLGVTGMLGSSVFKLFSTDSKYDVVGTARGSKVAEKLARSVHSEIITGIDVLNHDDLISLFERVRPNVVINCIGLVKQLSSSSDPAIALPINSILPHRLAKLCSLAGAKLVHISTDCVFSGRKGSYVEEDISDAEDLYGKSKFIGEIGGDRNVVTLRTSIIGHELVSSRSLVDWFLSQEVSVKGFAKAVFSGLPTVELARVIRDYVIPDRNLFGLFHVAAQPISKLDLLVLIAGRYRKSIDIIPVDDFVIDRSLSADKFKRATGYDAPEWPDLIELMHSSRL